MQAIKGLSLGSVSFKQLDHFKLLICLAMAVAFIVGINMMPKQQTFHDESYHVTQINAYAEGNFTYIDKYITVIPGYHALVYGLSKVFASENIYAYRIFSCILAALSLLFFYLIARQLGHDSPLISTAIFFFCPIFFPFFFVMYTDMTSLAFVLAGLYFTFSKRYHAAGVILVLSILIRQTNVVWLGFCWAMIFFQEFDHISIALKDFDRETRKKLLHLALRTIFFPLGIVAFLAFVYLNGGVAIGDAGSHKLGKVYFTQAFLWLFVVSLVLLPLHLAYLPRVYRLIKQSPEWLLLISAAFALYFLTFWADHHYNTIDFFIRNKFVLWLRASDLNKVLIAIPMALAFLGLAVTPMRKKHFYFLYPVMLISVLPHALIEQRYYMDTIALLMLFLHLNKRKIQVFTLALYIPVTTYLYSGISKIDFFL
ncbi:MAG: Dol-P-Glc:Glc(2)Man(9)GlcNAc(2)-PP-Dol alpha-1,2-glucosyltransferase [Agarilytica sp.]